MAVATIIGRPGQVHSLVIDSGDDETDVLDLTANSFRNYDLIIQSPATLTTTITVEISLNAGTNFVQLQSAGEDITIAAGKGTVISPVPSCHLRLKAAGAEGQADTFLVQLISHG